MDIDPHTLQQILNRIYKQMRCPQCGSKVPVDFSTVRVVGSGAIILQLKCETCSAFIVLHASLQGSGDPTEEVDDALANASTNLELPDDEIKVLSQALENSGGSFQSLFEQYGVSEEDTDEVAE